MAGTRHVAHHTKSFRLVNYFQSRCFSQPANLLSGDESVIPVLIVGAGPVGLVLSTLLTKLGIRCSILEKNVTLSNHPQAHFINNRSMEVFRSLDNVAEEIRRSQPPVDLWRKFIYCSSLTGKVLGSVDHMRDEDLGNIVSPVSVAHFSQYKLVRLLHKRLEELKFESYTTEDSQLNVPLRGRELLMGHECTSINAYDNFVDVTVRFFKEGKYAKRNIKCNILVGTDGARSTVRRLMGIKMVGEKDLQKLVSVHFFSGDLGQYLSGERPGMLFFVFNSEAIGVLVAHDLGEGEFVLQVPYYPPQQSLADFSEKRCKELITTLVGRELKDIDVRDVKSWVMHAEVAENFSIAGNRIILAGDAAHRFPPAGGFGMNTGIQDAHNLAWKIAAVASGIASSAILQTYEMERKPIAIFNSQLSVQNFKAASAVPAALGLDPRVANSVHEVVRDSLGSFVPARVQKALLEGVFTIGRAQLSDSFLNDINPIGSVRLTKLKNILEEGKSLQLLFPAADLGFRYQEGALICENDNVIANPMSSASNSRLYIPSVLPGTRLPHMYIRALSSKAIISTLDLVSYEELEFLVIIAAYEESYKLARAALMVAHEMKVRVRVCVMWPADIGNGTVASDGAFEPWKNFVDVVEVRRPNCSKSWWSLCQLPDRGAILVRPDGHVAWRIMDTCACIDPISEMQKVFTSILRLI